MHGFEVLFWKGLGGILIYAKVCVPFVIGKPVDDRLIFLFLEGRILFC